MISSPRTRNVISPRTRDARGPAAGVALALLLWATMPTLLHAQEQTQAPVANAAVAPSSDAGDDGTTSALTTFLDETTFGLNLDGYYGYNTNRPIGRINLLRAYDVSSNSFTLNQIGLVIDHAPDAAHGRRAGVRLDLMYGQATETLQGSAANEPRPQAYRPLFQAYGSYVVPLGKGLQVDFGKFASALGLEGNYTKDQINYSRSYFFNSLPFYHMGFRTSYTVNDRIALTYWLVNGAQQTEDFNGFQSQAAIVTLTPARTVTWNVNYYAGREGRELVPVLNPGLPSLPTQPGLSTTAVDDPDQSWTQIVDTYATWHVATRVVLAGEADDEVVRAPGAPARMAAGGSAYAQYVLRPDVHLAMRTEYLNDRDGLFSGVPQRLHEVTGTVTWLAPASHFMVIGEWRRDWSNQDFFLSQTTGVRRRAQNTFTLGLVWWMGNKTGAW